MPGEAPAVLSIDLALTSYQDIGVALVQSAPDGVLRARCLDLSFSGRPTADAIVSWITSVAEEHGVACVAIDGPLGWKGPATESVHCRLSERAVRAPGKTGLPPDGVKPRTYLAFSRLSIALFEMLTNRGWALPAGVAQEPSPRASVMEGRVVTEVFPTAAWRALGLAPLPGKSRARPADVGAWRTQLTARVPISMRDVRTHDQLQAVVGGLAPAWWAAGLHSRVRLAGAPPFRLEQSWREGFIMVPAAIDLWEPNRRQND